MVDRQIAIHGSKLPIVISVPLFYLLTQTVGMILVFLFDTLTSMMLHFNVKLTLLNLFSFTQWSN